MWQSLIRQWVMNAAQARLKQAAAAGASARQRLLPEIPLRRARAC